MKNESNNLGIVRNLTRQESGILIFESNEMIICNWSSIYGIPRLTPDGCDLMGLGEEIEVLDKREIDDIYTFLYETYEGKLTLLWDLHNNINDLEGVSGILYEIIAMQNSEPISDSKIIVIAPSEWV